jgi:hypothetical protein
MMALFGGGKSKRQVLLGESETEGRAPRNLHYDLSVTLKGGKKEKKDKSE